MTSLKAIRSKLAAALVAAVVVLAPITARAAVYGKQIGGGSGGGGTVTTSAPATGNGSGGSPVTVQPASGSQSGYLSSTDWNTIHALATVATSGLISDLSGTLAIARIAANSITLNKLVTASAGAFWCNPTGSPASVQECTFGSGLSLSGLGVLTASGGGLSITGTGVVHATSNAIDSAALPVYIPKAGTALTDANATINPGSDAASQYLAAVAETANRTTTIGTTGTPPNGMTVRVVRTSSAAFTRVLVDGGPAGTNPLCSFPASQTTSQACIITWNGTDWIFAGYQFVTF